MTPSPKINPFARRLFTATWATLLLAVALGAGLADARATERTAPITTPIEFTGT